MGIRDRAMEAREEEENPGSSKSKKESQYSLFEGGGSYGTSHRTYKPYQWDTPVYIKPKHGTIRMEISVEIEKLGKYGDPDNDAYDYDKMLVKAEEQAMVMLEEFAGYDIGDKYEITLSSEESIDTIEILATLAPINTK